MVVQAPSGLPTGTVTFLFTDIEGSTRLLTALGDRYLEALERHNAILRSAIAGHVGCEVEREGDSFFAVFPSAVEAVAAAADAQRGLAAEPWAEGTPVRVRMGLHSGEGRRGGTGYIGMDVYRAARISAAGHGGQVLLSDTTRALVAPTLPSGVTLRDLGEHRLKDLPTPERIWQLEIDGVPATFPELRSLERRPNNLPQFGTPLIGREAELAEIATSLAAHRLLTITGAGGAGKTRLALETAKRHLTDFADGVFFVPLDDVRERTATAAAIGSALGVRERPDRDVEEGLHAALREREILLVLDNCEQVRDVAGLVGALLAGGPRLRILATSRAVLRLSGEWTYEVPPLAEAVALFVERARAVRPDFAPDEAPMDVIARICDRLDGLPLAIELAAARVRLLTPAELLDRLDRRLPLLTGGAQDLPDRHKTLRGTIDWSYELLDGAERRLFERLAVCAGGCTLESVEEVCNPGDELGMDTLDGLASLADKSLVRPVSGGDGASRFEMLQVIREFATEQLESGTDGAAVRRRHALHFLALAEAAAPELVHADLRRWQDRLRREEDNLRAALRWAVDEEETDIGLRLAGALWRFWHYWGELREGATWLDTVMALPGADEPTLGRARAVSALAGIRYWQGREPEAAALFEEALRLYRRLGDDRQKADALLAAAWPALTRGDLDLARSRAEEALAGFERAGDQAGEALVSTWLGNAEFLTGQGGDAAAAVEATRRAVAVFHEAGRAYDEADALGTVAMLLERAGDHDAAWHAFREAIRANSEIRNLAVLPWLKFGARVELSRGRPERAATLAAAAEQSIDQAGGELPSTITGAGDPLADAQGVLDPEAFAAAVAAGRAMSLDDAVAYVLADA